jgi:tRNA(fMet)-specific endonuclease VapC
LIERVGRGERFVVTRRGRPVLGLVPAEEAARAEEHCFDTDVLSVFLRRGAPPATQRRLADVPPEEHTTTTVTLGELLYGAARLQSRSLHRAIEEYVENDVSIVPFDEPAAQAYAELRVELEAAGLRLDDPDLRIAAICLAHDLTLVTGNVRHFERVPGLRVENWLA